MLKKVLISVTALALFGMIGFAVAQPVQQTDQRSSFRPPVAQGFLSANSNGFATQPSNVPNSQRPAKGWILRMNDGEVVTAELASEFEITLRTAYGGVTLQSDEIISLRIISTEKSDTITVRSDRPVDKKADDEKADDKGRKIVVATVSGDIISGKSNFDSLDLKLSWGTATASADSIDFVCNRKFGVLTIVNDKSSPAFMLSSVQLESSTTKVLDHAMSRRVVTPGRLTQPRPSLQALPRSVPAPQSSPLRTLPNSNGF